ncbi:hypothetical protein [Chryseobacterium sp. RR2-3-20]|uniref:hypothetical protein n=1 Tax=Chryseobacterium sp. RR2-3-20 TaxID=2787626 RepID=UPI001AE0395E|nr:hypothetical protein [Chryseobacterium sp. RR2-3-20]
METIVKFLITISIIGLIGYSVIGTDGKVDAIKSKAPYEIKKRGWKILRYEGFQYGSWGEHGGKVWYHVADTLNPSIQYRVFITMWNNELQYHYGSPEVLQRIEVDYQK